MAGGDMLKVGVSGLQVFRRSLTTIGQNISNVNTEGFSRQVVEVAARYPTASGDGFIGNGVRVTTTKRLFDEQAAEQVRSRTTTTQFFSQYYQFSSQVDNLVADPDAGLSPAIDDFFDSMQEIADDPSSIPSRNVMITNAQSLVARFDTMDSWFSDIQGAVNDKIMNEVTEINQLATSIADLNGDIIAATGMGGGQPPNDLLDQRDRLIDKLSENLNVSLNKNRDGTVNVYVGSGQSLVLSTKAMTLTAQRDVEDPVNFEVAYTDPTTGLSSPISNMLNGGSLGGVLAFREEVLIPSINNLGRLAIGIATEFNAQHARGLDLTNSLGGDFFNIPMVTALVATDPPVAELYATESVNNVSTETITVRLNDIKNLTTDEYQLTYDGANYSLRNLETNQIDTLVIASGPVPIRFDSIYGMDIELSNTPAVNDRFLLRPNREGARDISVAISDPNLIATANPLRAGMDITNNSGFGTISEATISDYTNADLMQPITITFRNSLGLAAPAAADVYDVTGVGAGIPSIGNAYVPGATISFNGWDVTVDGTPENNDSFLVEGNINGVSDNRNALALADLQVLGTMIGGNASFQDAYSEIVVLVGNLTRQADLSYEAQSALLSQAAQLKDSISGVNLDEEAANLLAYQQAYAAAAQVIAAADEIFQTLISAIRR